MHTWFHEGGGHVDLSMRTSDVDDKGEGGGGSWRRIGNGNGIGFVDLSFLTFALGGSNTAQRTRVGLGICFSDVAFSGGGCIGSGDPANLDREGT
jgi:hypothetical protein